MSWFAAPLAGLLLVVGVVAVTQASRSGCVDEQDPDQMDWDPDDPCAPCSTWDGSTVTAAPHPREPNPPASTPAPSHTCGPGAGARWATSGEPAAT